LSYFIILQQISFSLKKKVAYFHNNSTIQEHVGAF